MEKAKKMVDIPQEADISFLLCRRKRPVQRAFPSFCPFLRTGRGNILGLKCKLQKHIVLPEKSGPEIKPYLILQTVCTKIIHVEPNSEYDCGFNENKKK